VATLALGVVAAGCGSSDSSSSSSGGGKKVALLLPESKTTRYETQDKPHFEQKVKSLCSDCEIIYENFDQDAAKQQQQAEAALTQGANILVLDPCRCGRPCSARWSSAPSPTGWTCSRSTRR
jgi:D-xylose transport system substrate-binding protein